MNILGFFSKIIDSLKKFFAGETFKKVESAAIAVSQLLQYALPAVEMVAKMTPTKSDDEIVEMIKKLNMPVELDLDKPLNTYEKQAYLNGAARLIIQGNLKDAILSAGRAGLSLGGQKIVNATDIPDNWLNSAINMAYTAFKATVK